MTHLLNPTHEQLVRLIGGQYALISNNQSLQENDTVIMQEGRNVEEVKTEVSKKITTNGLKKDYYLFILETQTNY